MLTSKRQAKCAVVLVFAFVIASVGEVKAGTAIGRASATVISGITSLPVVIRLQTPQLSTQSAPAGFNFVSFQSSNGSYSATQQSIASMISVSAGGVVSFSVSGDATSSYLVRYAGGNGMVVETQTVSPSGTSLIASNVATGLIVPAQVLIGGNRLSIEISQISQAQQEGNMIVEISYN